jgi:hypothetical protein
MKTVSVFRDASALLDRFESRGAGVDRLLARLGLMRTSRSSGALAMIGSFTVGVAIGAGLGVLFAPQSGAESRRAIRTKAEELYARAMSSADANDVSEDEEKPREKRSSKRANSGPGAQA